MAKHALIASLLLLTACSTPPQSTDVPHESIGSTPITNGATDWNTDIRVFHDKKRGVTCWYMTGGYSSSSPALSCLPDSELKDTTHDA